VLEEVWERNSEAHSVNSYSFRRRLEVLASERDADLQPESMSSGLSVGCMGGLEQM
jgi:hypothetical protein